MTLPRFIFLALLRIPVIRGAFIGPSDAIVPEENSIRIPILWVANAAGRLLICLALLGAAGFFVYSSLYPTSRSDVTAVDLNNAVFQPDEEFNEYLKSCGREELAKWLKNIDDDPHIEIENRRQALINRAEAAKKVGYSRRGSYRFFGIGEELRLRTELALLDLQQGHFDQEQIAILNETANLYESVEFPLQGSEAQDLKSRAKLGTILATLIEQVENRIGDESEFSAENVLMEIEKISTESTFSDELNSTVGKLSELLRGRLERTQKSTSICDQLDQLLVKIGNDRRQQIIDEFQSLNCSAILPKQLDYLKGQELEFQDRFLNDFNQKMEQFLQVDGLPEQDFSTALSKLADLARSGRAKVSKNWLDRVVAIRNESGQRSDEFTAQVMRLTSQLEWVGEDIALDDIQDVFGNKPDMEWEDNDATIVFYQPLSTVQKVDPKLVQLVRVYNSMIPRYRLQLVVVLIHDSKHEEATRTIETFSKNMRAIQFWQLDTNSDAGKKLKATIAPENLPYLLVLDSYNRVAAIDPLPRNVVGLVKKLKTQKSDQAGL